MTTLGTWLNNTRIGFPQAESNSFFGLGNFILPPMSEVHRIFVQTDFVKLWHYPWHDWLPIRQHTNVDVVFSPMVYRSLKSPACGESLGTFFSMRGTVRAMAFISTMSKNN
ncbi:hypothetical protein NBE99_05235 [Thermosynechococcus sp. HN-54]|uniref:hypothetical protein n=1 Tax=Thermosynechococcus sp. HN-54 TaxID=2933959 RepID=UPI00202CF38A|nr:hypothetical protein [Thermosynechococcus sp. HN-54]URR36540.1 hypothetical protein NBE99_05235 [Thermosynechococcus sp. HN-54]